MLQKLTMKLGRTLRRVLIGGMILCALCLVNGLLNGSLEDRTLFLGIGGGGLAVFVMTCILYKLGNRSKYRRLYDKVGEHGIQRLEEEYQKGERTKEAVFGDTHLFVEPGCNTLGFDMFEYSQILWMYLYQHTTKYMFIPVLRSFNIRIHLDQPSLGRQLMVEVNARRFRNDPVEFFSRIVAKNPNILLGYNPEWERMQSKDRENFIQFARSQQQVAK